MPSPCSPLKDPPNSSTKSLIDSDIEIPLSKWKNDSDITLLRDTIDSFSTNTNYDHFIFNQSFLLKRNLNFLDIVSTRSSAIKRDSVYESHDSLLVNKTIPYTNL